MSNDCRGSLESVPQWKRELILRRRAVARLLPAGSGSVQLSCPSVVAAVRFPSSSSVSDLHSKTCVGELEQAAARKNMRLIEQVITANNFAEPGLIPDLKKYSKIEHFSGNYLLDMREERAQAKKKSNGHSQAPDKKSGNSLEDEDGSLSDSSEELKYGPGIVSRLKSRYLSLTLRESQGRSRPNLPYMRRATSLENILDEPEDRKGPKPRYVKNSGGVNGSPSSERCRSIQRGNKDYMKRAGSVETLLRLNRRSDYDADTDKSQGGRRDRELVRHSIGSVVEEKELPPPDLVKHTLKIFESCNNLTNSCQIVKTNAVSKRQDSDRGSHQVPHKKPSVSPKPPCAKSIKCIGDHAKKSVRNLTAGRAQSADSSDSVKKVNLARSENSVPPERPARHAPRKESPAEKSPIIELPLDNVDGEGKKKIYDSDAICLNNNNINSSNSNSNCVNNNNNDEAEENGVGEEEEEEGEEGEGGGGGGGGGGGDGDRDRRHRHRRGDDGNGDGEEEEKELLENRSRSDIIGDGNKISSGSPETARSISPVLVRAPPCILSCEVSANAGNLPNQHMKQLGVVRPMVTNKTSHSAQIFPLIKCSINKSHSALTEREIEKNLINSVKSIEQPVTKVIVSLKKSPEECILPCDFKQNEESKKGSIWDSRKPNTMVFNFSNRKTVPDYIENDGLILAHKKDKPKREPGIIFLGGGTYDSSNDYDFIPDDVMSDPPSPCDFTFEGDNILINGKSNIQSKPKMRKMKIQFNDEATTMFEYPSEASLLDEHQGLNTENEKERNNSPVCATASVPLSNPFRCGSLASYTPSKISLSTDFQLGVTKTCPPTTTATTTATARAETPEEADVDEVEEYLRPADEGTIVTWSSETGADLLF